METMESKRPRPRRSFTPEFKADIVERCLHGDRSVTQVAHDFDQTVSAVRGWVRQAEVDAGTQDGSRPRRKRSCPGCAGRTAASRGCGNTKAAT